MKECICLLTLSMMYCKGIVKLSSKAGTDCCANTWIPGIVQVITKQGTLLIAAY
jgi:hypothetical protein